MANASKTLDAPAVLDQEFLEIRARLLQVAAQLDRLDRAPGAVESDPRYANILKAIAMLADERSASVEPSRAEQLQLLFSRPYDSNWKKTFQK